MNGVGKRKHNAPVEQPTWPTATVQEYTKDEAALTVIHTLLTWQGRQGAHMGEDYDVGATRSKTMGAHSHG